MGNRGPYRSARPFGDDPALYLILDPTTKQIRYVGATGNFRKRIESHCSAGSPMPVGRWIAQLRREGKRPIFVKVIGFGAFSTVEEEDHLVAMERRAIAAAAEKVGLALLNRRHNPLWGKSGTTHKYFPLIPA